MEKNSLIEKHWFINARLLSSESTEDSTDQEQARYQRDVFKTLLFLVAVACSGLGCAYLVPFVQGGSWPSLIIGMNFLLIAAYSVVALRLITIINFKVLVRVWLAFATWLVFVFGLLQPTDFIQIMGMGASIVIALGVFLEATRTAYQWALVNIGGYVVVLLWRNALHVPPFDLGALQPWVLEGTPILILIILTELGHVTTQHFKYSLNQSEARRKQLEVQGKQLRALAVEAQAARDKAEQADHIKSAFLASMSHELRTPLNAIINFTKFVAEGDLGAVNTDQREMLEEVVSSSQHLLSLINDVLDMSKIEAGSLTLFIEDNIDVTALVNTAVSSVKPLIMNKPVELRVHVADELPTIRADRQRILQVLLNLLSNACKFTELGTIDIRAYYANGNFNVSVQDTGPGIASEEQSYVFEAFKQTRSGLRSKGGTGLGMPISKSLVEAHGGRLWLESESGKGSTFYISIPVKSNKPIPAA